MDTGDTGVVDTGDSDTTDYAEFKPRMSFRLRDDCGDEATGLMEAGDQPFGLWLDFNLEDVEDEQQGCQRRTALCLFEDGHCELDAQLELQLAAGDSLAVGWSAQVEIMDYGEPFEGYPENIQITLTVE